MLMEPSDRANERARRRFLCVSAVIQTGEHNHPFLVLWQ